MGNTQPITREELHEVMDNYTPGMFFPFLPWRMSGLAREYIHDVGNLAPTGSFVGRYDEFQIVEIGRTDMFCVYACRFNDLATKRPPMIVLERYHSAAANAVRNIELFQEIWMGTPKLAAKMITVNYYEGEEFHWVYKITST